MWIFFSYRDTDILAIRQTVPMQVNEKVVDLCDIQESLEISKLTLTIAHNS